MIATLADLVSPLSEEAFVGALRARRPLLQRAAGAGRYDRLIDWDGFMQVATSGSFPARLLRMTRGGAPLPGIFFRDDDTPKPEAIARVMASDGSMIAYGVERYVPSLKRLCENITGGLGERIECGVIATSGPGGALELHYDECDIVVLQVEGSKRWIIHRDPVPDPVAGMPVKSREADPVPAVELDVTLEAGDFLFVPAGYRHRCENQGERSLHVGVFFWPLTAPRVLDLLFREMVKDPESRRPVRIEAAAAADAEAALKLALVEKIQSLSLAELRTLHAAVDPTPGRDTTVD